MYNDYTSSFDNLLIEDHSITIHQRHIQALAAEIYKTQNGLNPIFMKNIFSPSQHGYNTRDQIFSYPNPKTVTYGTQSFGYIATKVHSNVACCLSLNLVSVASSRSLNVVSVACCLSLNVVSVASSRSLNVASVPSCRSLNVVSVASCRSLNVVSVACCRSFNVPSVACCRS